MARTTKSQDSYEGLSWLMATKGQGLHEGSRVSGRSKVWYNLIYFWVGLAFPLKELVSIRPEQLVHSGCRKTPRDQRGKTYQPDKKPYLSSNLTRPMSNLLHLGPVSFVARVDVVRYEKVAR